MTRRVIELCQNTIHYSGILQDERAWHDGNRASSPESHELKRTRAHIRFHTGDMHICRACAQCGYTSVHTYTLK
jgi:hypothetical protein